MTMAVLNAAILGFDKARARMSDGLQLAVETLRTTGVQFLVALAAGYPPPGCIGLCIRSNLGSLQYFEISGTLTDRLSRSFEDAP